MTEPKQKAPRADAPSSAESLPALVGRLSEDLTTLVDSKLSLFKLEVKEDLRSYLRGGIRVGAGVLMAGVGFGLVSAATALLLSTLLAKAVDLTPPSAYALGFVLVGLLFMVGGLIVARRATHRLMQTDAAPQGSLQELEKDREWLRPGSS
jgi:uncharacterized membrane protein YqjE